MFFDIFGTFAEFKSDLIPLRTCEGIEIGLDTGNLRDKMLKLFNLRQRCDKTVPMLLWALLASGQIQIRKVDGWETLFWSIESMPLELAA